MQDSTSEVTYVEGEKVVCDGGKGALGHPLVYLVMGANGEVVCPYCSRHFVSIGEHGSH